MIALVRRSARKQRRVVSDANARQLGAHEVHGVRHFDQRKEKFQLHLPEMRNAFLGRASRNRKDEATNVANAFEQIDLVGKNLRSAVRVCDRHTNIQNFAHDFFPSFRAIAGAEVYAAGMPASGICGAAL